MGQHKLKDIIKPKYEKRIRDIKRIFCKTCNFNLIRVPQGYYDVSVTGTCSICIERIRRQKSVGET